MKLSLQSSALFAGMAILAGASPLFAQAASTTRTTVQPDDPRDHGVFFSIRGGFEHQFRADVDGGGDLAVSRASAGLAVRAEFTPDLDATFSFNYGLDNYRFRNATRMGIDPWDDVHTIGFAAIASLAIVNDWTLFGGPVLQFSRETGASWSDGFIGGGVFGATWTVSDDLTLGGGIGIVSQLEDDPRLFPVIVINWRITDDLRLSSRTEATGWGDTGVELIYDFAPGWEVAGGVGYRFRRFRLDNDGIAPGGVGEEVSMPLWARLTWHAHQNVSVNFYGGFVVGGKVRLENASGVRLAGEDYDPAGMLGASVNVRF